MSVESCHSKTYEFTDWYNGDGINKNSINTISKLYWSTTMFCSHVVTQHPPTGRKTKNANRVVTKKKNYKCQYIYSFFCITYVLLFLPTTFTGSKSNTWVVFLNTSRSRCSCKVAVRGVGGRGWALLEAWPRRLLVDGHAFGAVHRRARAPHPQSTWCALAARLHRLHQKHHHWRIARQNTTYGRWKEHPYRSVPRGLRA